MTAITLLAAGLILATVPVVSLATHSDPWPNTTHDPLTLNLAWMQVASGAGLTIWVADTFGGNVYRVTPYTTQ